jgi:hypothetical protein
LRGWFWVGYKLGLFLKRIPGEIAIGKYEMRFGLENGHLAEVSYS